MRPIIPPFVFLIFITCLSHAIAAPTPARAAAPAPGITGVFVDVAHIHHDTESQGDTWDWAWADDDHLYSFADDSRGYGHQGAFNVNFNELTGDSLETLVGSGVNTMSEYGPADHEFPNGATWKTTGCECIDGVLYAFIAPNWYGDKHAYGIGAVDPYLRQTVLNMSLVKSTDHGKTWIRSEQDNYDHPMWTSYKFSTAYFFKYGRNGGNTHQDDQDKYVYAISNDGYWNDGTNFYLGRVLRAKIGDLNASDWRYLDNGAWSPNAGDATPIPGFPNGQVKCASGSPTWLAPLRKYVTVTWYNPEPADTRRQWDYPADRIFDFYQADHPWGPWSIVGEKKASDFMADQAKPIHRWYGPSLTSKFVTVNPDGSVTAILTFSGQTWEDAPDSLYKNNACPVTFTTTPRPRLMQIVNDGDPNVTYSGDWSYSANRGKGDHDDDVHAASTPGAAIDFTFTGAGLEILTEKHSDLGDLEVMIDGVSAGTVSEHQNPFPLLYQVPLYRNLNLKDGDHQVKIIDRAPAGTTVVFDGYKIYGSGVIEPRQVPKCRVVDGTVTLTAETASLTGRLGLQMDATHNIGHWDDPADRIIWMVRFDAPGDYTITAKVSAQSGPTAFVVDAGSASSAPQSVPQTTSWDDYHVVSGTSLHIAAAGEYTVAVRPADPAVWKPMNLATLTLARK